MRQPLIIAIATLLSFTGGLVADGAKKPSDAKVSFKRDIAPIFAKHCVGCHNPDKAEGGYDMSTFAAIMKGGKKGKEVLPGEPYESRLVLMMYGDETPEMPQEADLLPEKVVAKVDRWVKQGAAFDGPDPTMSLSRLLEPSDDLANLDLSKPVATTALALRPDGKQLAVGGLHGITLWEVPSGKYLGRFPTDGERIFSLEYSADGKQLLHSGGTPGRVGEVILWDVAKRKLIKRLHDGDDVIFATALRPDGKEVAVGETTGKLRLFRTADGKQLREVKPHNDWILDVAYSPDGKFLLTGARDKTAQLWDAKKGELLSVYSDQGEGVFGVGFSGDGKQAFSTGINRRLHTWDATKGGKQVRAESAGGEIYSLATTADGKLVFTSGSDRLVKSWDTASGKAQKTFKGHATPVYSVAVSRDGKTLASGDAKGEVRLWDASTAKETLKFVAVPPKEEKAEK
ncbi:WD domain, G-beta repeat [Planctomycetes bacterium Pan216]|uniref:WD domain, G-beta repeat n=1 Tax=Kolteria novifilia TaxID=2527975 RepID=A0A518B828_9BACT|nr:WD domain, G-beta repeat [Planctomycetes bacterium Pan216]